MGQLWDYIEAYRDNEEWRPSNRRMADRLKVSPTAFGNWEHLRKLPGPDKLHRLSVLIGVPYRRLLTAALHDAGYLPEVVVAAEAVTSDELAREVERQQRDAPEDRDEPR